MTDTNNTAQPPAPKKKIVLKRSAAASTSVLNEPLKYNIKYIDEQSEVSSNNKENDHKIAKIINAKYLTKFDNNDLENSQNIIKRVLEINLDLENDIHYQPGDYISVFSPNPSDIVERLLERLKLSGDQIIEIECRDTSAKLPVHLARANHRSIRYLLTNELDICGIVSKRLLKLLGELATDDVEKQTLMKSAGMEGKEIYGKMLEERATVLSLLEQYTSVKEPSLSHLLDIITAQSPRDYSICSSPLVSPTKASFVFSVVDYPICDGKRHVRGLCTTWLESICKDNQLIQQEQKTTESTTSNHTEENLEVKFENLSINNSNSSIYIPYSFKSSPHFHLPSDLTKPLIMVGPGTGVAPFIGYLQHLEILQKQQQTTDTIGKRWLFFGCRSETKDYLYKDSLQSFVECGTLDHLVTAFSRESDSLNQEPLGYVQEKIKNYSKEMFDIVHNQNGYVYICGDAKGMAVGVRQSFIEIIKEQMNITNDNDAAEVWVSWSKDKRYLMDVWS